MGRRDVPPKAQFYEAGLDRVAVCVGVAVFGIFGTREITSTTPPRKASCANELLGFGNKTKLAAPAPKNTARLGANVYNVGMEGTGTTQPQPPKATPPLEARRIAEATEYANFWEPDRTSERWQKLYEVKMRLLLSE